MKLKNFLTSFVCVSSLILSTSCGVQEISNLSNVENNSSDDNKNFSILSEEDKATECEAKKLNPQADSKDRAVNRMLAKHKLNFKHFDKSLTVAASTSTTVISTATVDNRKWSSPVGNQGQLGSCTAFAAVRGAREYLLNKQAQPFVTLSPLMFYYEERKQDGTINYDAGSSITRSAYVLKNVGVSKETTWPYDITKFKIAPPASAYQEALQFRVQTIKKLYTLNDIKNEVKNGNPVIFGIKVYESFMRSTSGVIPLPNTSTERLLGGHAVTCLGFDDVNKVLIMKNSWGTNWGMKGYFTLPYGYFDLKLVMDVWTIT